MIDGQSGERWGYVYKGLQDFKGHFSELFQTNASTGARDGFELSGRLREVATGVDRLSEEARKEQQRREVARAWKKRQDERSELRKLGDTLGITGEDPPPGPPAPCSSTLPTSSCSKGRSAPPT